MNPFQRRQLDLMRQMEASLTAGSNASTIVPMQSDFASDPKQALTCITYVPQKIARTIQNQLIQPLKDIEPEFYYYPDEALHVTIQNIRVIHDPPNFSASDIAKVQNMLTAQTPKFGPFRFEFSGLLSMPTSISLIALVSPEYDQYVKHLRAELSRIGVPDDKHYFTEEIVFANTTICRYTHAPSQEFLKKVHALKDIEIDGFTAGQVALVTMNAGAHPTKTHVLGTYEFARI